MHTFYIAHAGADELSIDGSHLAGAICYYASLADAAARHKYVRTVTIRHTGSLPFDYLSKRFENAPAHITGYLLNGDYTHTVSV